MHALPARRRDNWPSVIVAAFALQLLLLTIGVTREYQLKHEDNNALHATFARSHLRLGLETTRAQNYFYSPSANDGMFYPNHPPGPGLVLAGAYALIGHDGPFVTRAVAIAFHILGTWLFYGLLRRVLRQRWEIALALFLYVLLPESAFFGRMLNHEVLVLPAAILLVRAYWEAVHGDWTRGRWMTAMVLAAAWGAISGWAGFFPIAACALHAGWEVLARHNRRARPPLVALLACGALLGALTVAHLLWVLGGDAAYLRQLLASRSTGATEERQVLPWIARVLELHWRYFGLTSAAGLAAIALRALRRRRDTVLDPAQELGLIFLISGAGYVGVFLANATKHDYWQFLLLPATALGIVLLVRSVRGPAWSSRRVLQRTVLGFMLFDIALVTTVTLVQRHVKKEGYCLRVVEEMRRNWL